MECGFGNRSYDKNKFKKELVRISSHAYLLLVYDSKYYCSRRLKEAMLTSSDGESSPKLEEILSAELAVRPKVSKLKVRPF